MSTMNDSYARYIALLDQLDEQMSYLLSRADGTRTSYENQIRRATAAGFVDDYTSPLINDKFPLFSQHVEDLMIHIKKTRKEISEQKDQLEVLRRTASRGR
jgi:hypothetical protein